MYSLELVSRPLNSDVEGLQYRHVGVALSAADAADKAETLCARLSTVAVRVWHMPTASADPVVIAEYDGFHS